MKHRNIDELPRKYKEGSEGYGFYRRDLTKVHEAESLVRVYEIPPGKSAYPYHYHLKNEETFFILKGEGLLRTPSYHAGASLFSLCSCYTSKFSFSYLLYVVADDKEILLGIEQEKKMSDISKAWIKNVLLKPFFQS